MNGEWWTSWDNWAAALGPWGRRGRFFDPGEVRLALLSLLSERPCHGYELMKELEARSGGAYRASAGTIYPTLQQMEDEGLVTSVEERGKRVYRLTEAGRGELDGSGEAVERIWRRAEGWEEWGSWAGLETALVAGWVGGLVREAFRAAKRCGGSEEGQRAIRDILRQARGALEALEGPAAGSAGHGGGRRRGKGEG